MVNIGRLNALRVVRQVDFGLYLDGGELGEILMPARYAPRTCAVGDELESFIYRDSEDRLVATTEKPYAMVGEFTLLKVVAVNRMGAFLKWGLMKDLLVPFAEQKPRMQEGGLYVVRIYVDESTRRIVASARLDDFLHRESEDEFEVGEAVRLFIANRTDLGYQVIIDNSYWGLLHRTEALHSLKRGETVDGFIKHIREDGRIDVCLHLKASEKTGEAAQLIMNMLKKNNGRLPITDKSSPEAINRMFGLSKKMYKKAAGALYKKRAIAFEDGGIRLLEGRDIGFKG
jgi:predicted RNA-binding protein (virulence factor B family)